MEKYNLDDKGGLFKFVEKKASKVVKQGDAIELKHFALSSAVKAKISEVSESTIRIQAGDKAGDAAISQNDHVILEYSPSGETFVVTGEIGTVNSKDPIDLTVKVVKIEKLKDLVKEKKQYVSLPSTVKIIGVPDGKPASVKVLSFGGVKINCNEDIMAEDIIELTVNLDKASKMNFKGRVVRKNKLGNLFEYGIEYTEVGESCNRAITHSMYDYENRA